MAICTWAVLCRRAIIDRESNLISLIDAVERLVIQDAPPPETYSTKPVALSSAKGDKLVLASLWWRTDPNQEEKAIARLKVVAPKGTFAREESIEINLADSYRHRVMMTFEDFPFCGFGVYRFELEIREEEGTWVRQQAALLEVAASGKKPSGAPKRGSKDTDRPDRTD